MQWSWHLLNEDEQRTKTWDSNTSTTSLSVKLRQPIQETWMTHTWVQMHCEAEIYSTDFTQNGWFFPGGVWPKICLTSPCGVVRPYLPISETEFRGVEIYEHLFPSTPVSSCWPTSPKSPKSKICSDITNTLVGISGETGPVVRISCFIEYTVVPPDKWWF